VQVIARRRILVKLVQFRRRVLVSRSQRLFRVSRTLGLVLRVFFDVVLASGLVDKSLLYPFLLDCRRAFVMLAAPNRVIPDDRVLAAVNNRGGFTVGRTLLHSGAELFGRGLLRPRALPSGAGYESAALAQAAAD
jgi:hypothetical protein